MDYRTIDDALHGFVVSSLGGKPLPAARRVVAVDDALRRYLDSEDATGLTADERVLAALDRDLGTTDPVARLLPADRLLDVLPGFVARAPAATAVRRARLSQVWRLVQWLRSRGLIDTTVHAAQIDELRQALASARTPRFR